MGDSRYDTLLDPIPALAGRVRVEELSGGLTNLNLRVVTADGGDYVVRTSASDAGLLGIDRDAEAENTRRAASAGVGAPVVDFRPGSLTIGFIPGQTLTNESFADPDVLARAAAAVRRLHAGPSFVGRFDMFERQRRYRATARERGFRIPATYDDFAGHWDRVRAALAAGPEQPLVPCNNDLLAGNFIDDGERVWLIDYEYSGENDAAFELGNTAAECDFAPELRDAYAEAYFGTPTKGDLARVRLGALRSEYGWSLWGFIQAAASSLDFDFHAWGEERFEKAVRTFTADGFDRLLEEAAGA